MAAAAVAAPLAPAVQAAEPAPAAAAETRLPHISVVRLGTRRSAVVLIPGLSTPRAVWYDFAPALAERHFVTLDQPDAFRRVLERFVSAAGTSSAAQ